MPCTLDLMHILAGEGRLKLGVHIATFLYYLAFREEIDTLRILESDS